MTSPVVQAGAAIPRVVVAVAVAIVVVRKVIQG